MSCHGSLGFREEGATDTRIQKWNLSVNMGTNLIWEQYPVQSFICSRLSRLIESQATRKFVAHDGVIGKRTEGLLVRALLQLSMSR